MNDEQFFLQLRDCFSAGYNLPQFCIDNEIKNPVFAVADPNNWQFLWEIYVQFSHYKKIKPTFVSTIMQDDFVRLSPCTLFDGLQIKSSVAVDLGNYDKIFLLTTKRAAFESEKIIYLDELVKKFILAVYVENPFLHFLQRYPKIKLFLTNFTVMSDNPIKTENELQIVKENTPLATFAERLRNDTDGTVKTPYDFLGYSKQDLIDMLTLTGTKTNPDGSTVLIDNDNPLIRVENGRRVVPNQPEKFKNRIYFLGGCSHLGVGAPFDKTIPSYLQKFLNEKNLPYRVENVSQFFTYRYQDVFYNLQNLPLRDGDIVFVFFDNYLSEKLPSFDVSKTFERPHNYGEVFVNVGHVNELGYKALAEKFFDFLTL